MPAKEASSAAPRASRHSRDLTKQIAKAQAAIQKALEVAIAPLPKVASPRASRHSKDLIARLESAAAALGKAHELAVKEEEPASPRVTRHSRDLRPKGARR